LWATGGGKSTIYEPDSRFYESSAARLVVYVLGLFDLQGIARSDWLRAAGDGALSRIRARQTLLTAPTATEDEIVEAQSWPTRTSYRPHANGYQTFVVIEEILLSAASGSASDRPRDHTQQPHPDS